MNEVAINIFASLLTELVTVVTAILLKDDKRKVAIILTVGTVVAGIIAFSPQILQYIKYNQYSPETEERANGRGSTISEIPPIVKELAAISNVNLLLTKLNEYKKKGILAVGEKDNFENPDGFFVFVVDEKRIYGVFLFQNSFYIDVHTNNNFTDLPPEFKNKQQIWTIEPHKLVQQ